MSVVSALRSRAPRGTVGLPAVVGATVAAVAGGAAIGLLAGADSPAEPPAARAPQVGLRSGVAQLPLPPGWLSLGRRSSIPGLEEATAVRAGQAEVALDIRAPEHPSLLPAGVAGAPPITRRLGARSVWHYDLDGSRADRRVVALVLPTTGGVVTIACESRTAAAGECERAAQAVQLEGATALAPAPETAAAIVLPATVARLDRSRVLERRRLAATRSSRLRSAAARRLARAYARAAAALRPLAAGDSAHLVATLDALARRHRTLAVASRRRYAAVARRAGRAIRRDERRLGALIAATQRKARSAGYSAR
jgi:hypothetical protein